MIQQQNVRKARESNEETL